MNFFAPVAVWGFWVLLVVGWALDELRLKGVAIFILLWLAGFVGVKFWLNEMLFLPYVAVLDIALVLIVFKGDLTLR